MIETINSLLSPYPDIQAIIVIAVISALGLALGKIKVRGISLGVTFVFFVGIMAGHVGLQIDHSMLIYAESFGLVIFVYALGLQVGPGFFSLFRSGGVGLNLWALLLVLLGTGFAMALIPLTGLGLPEMVGVLCGATTNTPALAAAQQTAHQLGLPYSDLALSCAVTYPLGVVGVILAIIIVRKFFVDKKRLPDDGDDSSHNTYISEFHVTNPEAAGHTIREISASTHKHFVISRIWRDGKVFIPTFDTSLKNDDRFLAISAEEDVPMLTRVFGDKSQKNWNDESIDWNKIDSNLISMRIVVTRSQVNGKKLGDLKLRNNFGVNITRIYRSGIQLLAQRDLVLQFGDKLTVVGEKAAVHNVESVLGNAIKSLKEPNLIMIFIGIILGLSIGIIPIAVPGMGNPIRLGLAGGPIVAGILVGAFGPRMHMVTYTTRSVNLMLRAFGLAVYLACLGIDSGKHFFETVVCADGLIFILSGFAITVMPTILLMLLLLKCTRLDFGTISGIACGGMANPMALDYAGSTLKGETSSVAYAAVYPLSMFIRVILAQIVLMLLL